MQWTFLVMASLPAELFPVHVRLRGKFLALYRIRMQPTSNFSKDIFPCFSSACMVLDASLVGGVKTHGKDTSEGNVDASEAN